MDKWGRIVSTEVPSPKNPKRSFHWALAASRLDFAPATAMVGDALITDGDVSQPQLKLLTMQKCKQGKLRTSYHKP